MAQQNRNHVPLVVLGFLLVLTIPLLYVLVARVLLPVEWDEPQYKEPLGETTLN